MSSVAKCVDVTYMMNCFAGGAKIPRPLPNHFRESTLIGGNMWVGPLKEPKDDVRRACDSPGYNWLEQRAGAANYAFYRDAPCQSPHYGFDPERALMTAVQLSRIVKPTSIGYRYAARVAYDDSGTIVGIYPARLPGCAQRSWVADPSRNWLEETDLARLQRLLPSFDKDTLPERVLRAMWMYEYVHQMYYVDVRWPMVVTGLEALIHTDRHGSTRQFTRRVAGLRSFVPELGVDEAVLADIYDRRSAITHGQTFDTLSAENMRMYSIAEEALRATLLRALEDPTVADVFASEATVREALPLDT